MQIRPFLFSWPTGTFHNYITAIKRGAEGDQTQVDFVGACMAPIGLVGMLCKVLLCMLDMIVPPLGCRACLKQSVQAIP